MVIAEFSVTSVVGESMTPYIDAAINVVKESGLKFEVDALSTTIEGDLDQVLEVIGKAHRAALRAGAKRVLTGIQIDERESAVSIEQQLEGYRAAI